MHIKISILTLLLLFVSSCGTQETLITPEELPTINQEQEVSAELPEEISEEEEIEVVQDEGLEEFENVLIDLLESTE